MSHGLHHRRTMHAGRRRSINTLRTPRGPLRDVDGNITIFLSCTLLTAMYSKRNATHSPSSGSKDSETSTSRLDRLHHAVSVDSQRHGELVDHESNDSSDELDGPPDDLTYHIRRLRIDFVNWRLDWGETNWETEFSDQLRIARQEGQIL